MKKKVSQGSLRMWLGAKVSWAAGPSSIFCGRLIATTLSAGFSPKTKKNTETKTTNKTKKKKKAEKDYGALRQWQRRMC